MLFRYGLAVKDGALNLKLLMDVLALIEEKSFTKAAQRRHVTQSAFSRRISTMEDWLGYKCVDRSGSTITITQEALGTEERIRSLINQMQELKGYMASESRQKKRIIFTAPHTHSIYLFANLIEYLNEAASVNGGGYSYRLKSAYKRDCLALFLRGDADIFICNEEEEGCSIPSSFQFQKLALGKDHLIPVVGGKWRDHLAAQRQLPKEIPLIAYPDTSYLWKMLSRELLPALKEKHDTDVICETGLSAGVKEMAQVGLGLGWLPRSFVHDELSSSDLVDLSDIYGSIPLDLVMYMSKAAVESGLDEILEIVENMDEAACLRIWG